MVKFSQNSSAGLLSPDRARPVKSSGSRPLVWHLITLVNRGNSGDTQTTCQVNTAGEEGNRKSAHMGVRVGVLTGEWQEPYMRRFCAPLGYCVRPTTQPGNNSRPGKVHQTETGIVVKLGQSIAKITNSSV